MGGIYFFLYPNMALLNINLQVDYLALISKLSHYRVLLFNNPSPFLYHCSNFAVLEYVEKSNLDFFSDLDFSVKWLGACLGTVECSMPEVVVSFFKFGSAKWKIVCLAFMQFLLQKILAGIIFSFEFIISNFLFELLES